MGFGNDFWIFENSDFERYLSFLEDFWTSKTQKKIGLLGNKKNISRWTSKSCLFFSKFGEYCIKNETKISEKCPSGSFCENVITKNLCLKGFYCPKGSHKPIKCDDTKGLYCPIGSKKPKLCEEGFYCPNSKQKIICPKGSFCKVINRNEIFRFNFCS